MNRKISEYKTAYASTCLDLDKKVQKLIAEGFQPFGNPYKGNSGMLLQAMVKYVE